MKKTFFLFLMIIGISITANLVHPVTPALVKSLGLGDWLFGVAYAMMNLFNFLGSFYWSIKLNHWGPKKVVSSGLLIYAIGQFLFSSTHSVIPILTARALSGFAASAFNLGLLSYVVNEFPDEQRAKKLTDYTILNILGANLGFLIGGYIGNHYIYDAFYFQIALSLVISMGWYVFLSQYPAKSITNDKINSTRFSSFIMLIKNSSIWISLFFVSIFILFSVNTVFDQSFNYYLKDQLNYFPKQIGVIKLTVGILTALINMLIIGKLIKKINHLRVLNLLMLLSIMMGSIVIGFKGYVFIGAGLVVLIFTSLFQPFLQQETSLLSSDQMIRNNYLGFYNAIKSLGGFMGGLLASGFYLMHPLVPFVVFVFGITISLGGLVLYGRKNDRERTH